MDSFSSAEINQEFTRYNLYVLSSQPKILNSFVGLIDNALIYVIRFLINIFTNHLTFFCSFLHFFLELHIEPWNHEQLQCVVGRPSPLGLPSPRWQGFQHAPDNLQCKHPFQMLLHSSTVWSWDPQDCATQVSVDLYYTFLSSLAI